MAGSTIISSDYWKNLQITPQDLEFLHTHLFETETPLTTRELVSVLVTERNRAELLEIKKRRTQDVKAYVPKESYEVGDDVVFSMLNWKKGKVTDLRDGSNPELGEFKVITVEMEDGSNRLFSANLANHPLNELKDSADEEKLDMEAVFRINGHALDKKLEKTLLEDQETVRIAGRWFPRALLVEVNVGNLNLAEAALDMSGGEPLPTHSLLKDVALADVNPKLAEFSLNLALQDDGRFDEVGPAGEVLWSLFRLEPQGVQRIPDPLLYLPIDYDRSEIDGQMLQLEKDLDDELTDLDVEDDDDLNEVNISLIYPHLRAGTLPLSHRVQSLFPTAYESPRVRFTLVDGKTGEKFPGWVVREHKYVFGLDDLYKKYELIPGSLITVRKGVTPGEVIIDVNTHRSTKDWLRTAIVGADGGVVFAMLKQAVASQFNDRMAFAIPAFDVVDQAWNQNTSLPLEKIVKNMIREVSKLNPQGHVHAQELYSAVNIIRRVPPAPLFAMLASNSQILHVGDLHFRLSEDES